jgi:GNAT superfamily N-acetyltransferase
MRAAFSLDHVMEQRTCTRLATRTDGAAIGALRLEAFSASPDFRIANARFIERLRWTEEDDVADVLAVWREGKPVATMRMEVISDRRHAAAYASGLMPPPDHTEWPALALARVATHHSDRGTGFNALLRSHFLQAALASGARRFYAYVVSGAPRTRMMAQLGYQFLPRSDQDPDLASARPWSLAWLDLHRHGPDALARLEAHVRGMKEDYPWVGPKLRVPDLRPR